MVGSIGSERMEALCVSEAEAAKMLGVCQRHLVKLRDAGLIPFVRMGRRVLYSVESLRQWLREREQRGQGNGHGEHHE
jgi:excisionase family DNA binding protein